MKKAFLICPVRGSFGWGEYVQMLEAEGYTVHYPPRDTPQDDPTGLRICSDNLDAILTSDRVFVIWDGKSQGCLFDLGIAFALHKAVTILEAPAASEGKSYQNMMRAWESSQNEASSH